jgi:pyruvate/2-oxoglutarate dehydrogenase complex dihydrolipoamide dehydrogenase (E3) component
VHCFLQAEEDGIACVENIAGLSGHVNYNTVPSIVYTHPEVASVGHTEEQVKAAGTNYRVCSPWNSYSIRRKAILRFMS